MAGSIAPIIASALLNEYGTSTPIALYLLVARVITGIAVLAMKETRGISLRNVDKADQDAHQSASYRQCTEHKEKIMKGITTVITAPGKAEQREYEVANPVPGGMILRMIRANVCGSDVAIINGRHPLINVGCVMGHEGVGVIERLGEGVTRDFAGNPLAVGDRVVATYFQACRRCPECNLGKLNLCRNAFAGWSQPAAVAPHFHGSFSTYYSVGPDQFVYKVPENVSSKAVSSANCALSQVTYGCQLGEIKRGQKVLVLGAGGLGVCASAVASEMGGEVFIAEMAANRLPKAREFGARHLIDLSVADGGSGRVDLLREVTNGGADVVIDLTGVPGVFSEAARSLRPGGIMVEIGSISPGRYTDFDPGLFTRSGTQLRAGLRYPAQILGKAVDFIASTPQFPWEDLVDAEFEFDDFMSAVTAAEQKQVTRAALLVGSEA
nr:alcohol dehydrogenase catalytic domain-containing protein [Cryobacterium sp. Y50]